MASQVPKTWLPKIGLFLRRWHNLSKLDTISHIIIVMSNIKQLRFSLWSQDSFLSFFVGKRPEFWECDLGNSHLALRKHKHWSGYYLLVISTRHRDEGAHQKTKLLAGLAAEGILPPNRPLFRANQTNEGEPWPSLAYWPGYRGPVCRKLRNPFKIKITGSLWKSESWVRFGFYMLKK